jgi:hypothetical protein
MSLQTDGYLSTDIGKWIAKHRAEHAAAFALADRLNRVAQQVMLGAEVPKADNRSLLIVLFFARCLSSFQGALLMVERGMTIEALTLARNCLESSFFLGAVVADAGFADRLVQSDTAHKKKVATWLTSKDAAVTELSPEQIENLRGFLDKLKTAGAPVAPLSIKQAADAAQLSAIYETVYRDLSDRAAHPSLHSLLRHIELDDHGNAVGLRFGPDAKDLTETILAMTTALFYGIVGMGSVFAQSEWTGEIDVCWEIHKRLIDTCETTPELPPGQGGRSDRQPD